MTNCSSEPTIKFLEASSEVAKLYSLDNGTSWQEDAYATSYRWSDSLTKANGSKLDEALEIGKEISKDVTIVKERIGGLSS